jgi:hypothetical protein
MAGMLMLCGCAGFEQNPVAVVTAPPIDPHPMTGTWTATDTNGLVGYSFSLSQRADGAISGAWRGTQIGCTRDNCIVGGTIMDGSTKNGQVVKLSFVSSAQDVLGFIEATLVGNNEIQGTMYQWLGSNRTDEPDWSVPIDLWR